MHLFAPFVDLSAIADAGAARQLELVELRDLVRRIIAILTPTEQMIVILVFWGGFTLTEIAALRSVSKQSTAEAYKRALARGRAYVLSTLLV